MGSHWFSATHASRLGVLLFGMSACVTGPSGASGGNSSENTGAVGLQLTLAPGVVLDSLTYTITDPAVLASDDVGAVDLSHTSVVRFVVGGLPPAGGYTLTLSGTTADGDSCASAPAAFSIVAGQTTAVSVTVVCTPPPGSSFADSGTLFVEASVVLADAAPACPAVAAISALPAEAVVGGSLALSTTATDPAAVLTWSATDGGTLAATTGTTTTFTCTQAGSVTITATATTPGTACSSSASVVVSCDAAPAPDASAPDSGPPEVDASGADASDAADTSNASDASNAGDAANAGDASDAGPTACLTDGYYYVPYTASTCTPRPPPTCTDVCAAASDVAVIHVTQDSSGQWVAQYVSDSAQTTSTAGTTRPDLTGSYPITPTAAGFRASGPTTQCLRIPPLSTAPGTLTLSVDCTTGGATLQLSCATGSPFGCTNPVYQATASGTCTQCASYPGSGPQLQGATSLSGGPRSTFGCGLLGGGAVDCWGDNEWGQLGLGGNLVGVPRSTSVPGPVAGLTGVRAISGGLWHECAILSDLTVDCWGDDQFGELGSSIASQKPVPVAGVSGAVALAAGAQSTCALLSDGTAQCWGDNEFGELGNGGPIGAQNCQEAPCSPTPVVVSSLAGATAISVGDFTACALLMDGTSECWGDNGVGEFGNGNQTSSSVPAPGSGLVGLTSLSVGRVGLGFTCGALPDGTVDCWGDPPGGNGVPQTTPLPVVGLSHVVAVASGDFYACALVQGGTVMCWGDNSNGQLGGTSTGAPVVVAGVTDAVAISVSSIETGDITCALLSSGQVDCWGDGASTAAAVPGVSGAVAVAAGGPSPCAVLQDGSVTCWGGPGSTASPVAGVTGATAISSGGTTTCVLRGDGTVACWGSNTFGLLGTSTPETIATPVTVPNLAGAISISVGPHSACSILADHTARCWGDATEGELGDGTSQPSNSSTPTRVVGLAGATAIAAGSDHYCALVAGGGVSCWGDNESGQLGDGLLVNASAPVAVPGLTGAVAVAAGDQHTCALLGDGGVTCWGANGNGQLGNGQTVGSLVPVAATSPGEVASLAAGGQETCAALADGTLRCWGAGASGQLGNGGFVDQASPVEVIGLRGVSSVVVGEAHACAVAGSGAVSCWGANGSGQLGNGTTAGFSFPVPVNAAPAGDAGM